MSFIDDALVRQQVLIKELEHQSDRGAAIVGLAWVEEALQAALESFLEDDKTSRERLFRTSGPLSTLSAKIDLARLLGVTTRVVTSDLHTLRAIRNEFAHSVLADDNSALSFSTSHLRDKCMSLKVIAHEEIDAPRHAFVRACAILNADFYLHRLVGEKVADGGRIYAKIEDDPPKLGIAG